MRRQIIDRIPALAALFILCLISYLYIDGWFDISFIVRGKAPTETAAETSGGGTTSSSAATDENTTPPTTDNNVDTTGTSSPSGTETSDPEPVLIPEIGSLEGGWSLSTDEWSADRSWTLAEAKLDKITFPGYFSSYQTEIDRISYEQPGIGKQYEIIRTPKTIDAPSVTLYMGYIIVESQKKNTVNIYSSDGGAIGSYDSRKVSPAWCRDREGRPLFTTSGAYYYLDASKKKFALSDYDPNTDNRGALFDYTSDYGTSKEKRRFTSKKELVDELVPVKGTTDTFYVVPTMKYFFAIANANGEPVSEYLYSDAYEFSDSRAAVVDGEGHLYYITTSGAVAIEPSRKYTDKNINRSVIEYYMEPLSNGPESIGFYFFEHGLTRARILTLDSHFLFQRDKVYVISDENVVIDTSGKRFTIPIGYEVVSYSSGIFLLRGRDGCGYMDYTGTWIVDPDLDEAEPFYEGLGVAKKDGKYAVFDTSGNIVVPFGQFSYISNASSGIIAAYDTEWHIFYKMEK